MTLRFHQTCFACPEQYDVFDGEKKVAYLRLRWGLFSVTCPDVGGEVVYQAEIGNDGWTGCFDDEAQRMMHLKLAEAAILDWLEKNA